MARVLEGIPVVEVAMWWLVPSGGAVAVVGTRLGTVT